MSPKEQVRARVYKSLFEEEVKKNKKISVFSIGLFLVGIVTFSVNDTRVNKPLQNDNFYAKISNQNKEDLMSSMYTNSSSSELKRIKELNPDELFLYDTQI